MNKNIEDIIRNKTLKKMNQEELLQAYKYFKKRVLEFVDKEEKVIAKIDSLKKEILLEGLSDESFINV